MKKVQKKVYSRLIQHEKQRIISELAPCVYHDTKNSIAVIFQGADYLKRKIKTKDKNILLALEYIEKSIRRINEIIEKWLDFSGSQNIKIASCNINSIIESVLILLQFQLKKFHVDIIKDYGKDLSDIRIDKNGIRQIFMILFLNAVYAMPDGGELKIRTYCRKTKIVSEFEDTGKIVAALRESRYGLEGVKAILNMYKGKIEIKNKRKKGVKVIVAFLV
jgi:two-component system NtrC family sensor kinase